MGRRAENSGEILRQSWHILRSEKELLCFPLLSAAASLLVILSFIAPIFLAPELLAWAKEVMNKSSHSHDAESRATLAAFWFAFYAINYFVVVFFNTALASCAIARFRGEQTSIKTGLAAAVTKLPQIVAWVLLASTVGTVLKMISERSALVGKIVAAILGVVWSIAIFLVVPVLAVEGRGPITSLKRSAALISDCWGEGLIGNFSLGLLGLLFYIPVLVVFVGGLSLLATDPYAGFALLTGAVVLLMGFSIGISATKQVFIAGLYLYAAEKKVPQGFTADIMQGAFRKK